MRARNAQEQNAARLARRVRNRHRTCYQCEQPFDRAAIYRVEVRPMMCVSCLIVLYVRHSVNEPFGDTRKIRVTRTITFTCIVISGENA